MCTIPFKANTHPLSLLTTSTSIMKSTKVQTLGAARRVHKKINNHDHAYARACESFTCTCILRVTESMRTTERETEALRARFFTLFQIAFSLPIGFSASLEGSVIELKPAALVPQDTAVSLKA